MVLGEFKSLSERPNRGLSGEVGGMGNGSSTKKKLRLEIVSQSCSTMTKGAMAAKLHIPSALIASLDSNTTGRKRL